MVQGASNNFEVVTNEENVTYQWKYLKSDGTWGNTTITGSKTSKISMSATAARNGNQYRCVITDAAGNTTTSDIATLTVVSITTQPSDSTVTVGETAKFNVGLSSTNGITYQWKYQLDDGSWANTTVTGSKTATVSISGTVARNGHVYKCVISDATGNTIETNAVTLTVNKIVISTVPSQSGTLTYTGNAQSPSWSNYDSTQLTLAGDTSKTNAGTYTATFTPTTNYEWSDGTTTAKSVNWTIGKASGSLSLNKSSASININATTTATVTRSGNGTITVKSSDTTVATATLD